MISFTVGDAFRDGKALFDFFGAIGASGKFTYAVEDILELEALVQSSGYDSTRIQIDPSVVRGLEYYTGMVYEAELLFDVTNEKGEKVQFGSVGGGGRYDGLIKRFTGRDVPATGFSIGVSRLMTALKNLGKLGTSEVTAPVLVTVMDGDTKARSANIKKWCSYCVLKASAQRCIKATGRSSAIS